MAYSEVLLKRRQWHTLDSATHFLSILLSEEVYVAEVIERVEAGEIPVFVELSMSAWRLVDINAVPAFHFSFSVQEHPIPHPPLPGLKVDTDDTDCVLLGKYQLQIPSDYAKINEWYVKDPDNGQAYIPGHQFRSLPSGKSFPERPAKPAPEEWLFKKSDIESFVSQLHSDKGEDEMQKRNKDEVKALEVLGLMAETFAARSQKHGGAKKPNVSQIAKAMSVQSGQAKGMSERKLQEYISDGLNSWEEYKQ